MRVSLFSLVFAFSTAATANAQLPRLTTHDHKSPAGSLKNGVLTLDLEIVTGMWHPDAESSGGTDVIAIGIAGRRASVPGPLIRVPAGTELRTRVRNTLNESVIIYGLHKTHALADSIRMQAGETREFVVKASAPGNYMYGVMRRFRPASPENPPMGNDMVATGALIVDDPGVRVKDRVLVISMMLDSVEIPGQGMKVVRLVTFNGKSWPHTERFTHNVGDTVVWRVLNASIIGHPMHLHGFYFDVMARGNTAADTVFTPAQVRKAVTERMLPLTTMTMRWVPERPGHWLFHCHLPLHTARHTPLSAMKASHETHVHDVPNGMSNLMMAITVRGTPARDAATRRQIRLNVHRHDSVAGDRNPPLSYSFSDTPERNAAGPTIVLQQNEPTAITVINRGVDPTAVHWHGIELESFNDGTPGFGGHGKHVSPLIAPKDSFTARMTPPRAGTFIYHTHVDEVRQQAGGLYGALLVIPPGAKYDAEMEPVIVLGTPNDTSLVLFNGQTRPTFNFRAGKTYRLRMIHIMVGRPATFVTLLDAAGKPQSWTLVAKDGADLPLHQQAVSTRQAMGPGETYDVLFTPAMPGEMKFELRGGNGGLLGFADVRVSN